MQNSLHKFPRHFRYFTIQKWPRHIQHDSSEETNLVMKVACIFFLFWLHCNKVTHDDTILPFLGWCGHSYNGDFFSISCLIAQRNFFNGLGQQDSSFFAFISEMHTPREFQILIGLDLGSFHFSVDKWEAFFWNLPISVPLELKAWLWLCNLFFFPLLKLINITMSILIQC